MLSVEEYPCHLGIRTDEVQKAAIVAAAASHGVPMSEWIRSAIQTALEAEKASPQKPQKVPHKAVERSPAVQTFMKAVKAANARDRPFR